MHTNPSSPGAQPISAWAQASPQNQPHARVVFIVCEAGGGHISAARAITQALHYAYPGQYETKTVCVEDMVGPFGRFLGTLYGGSYNLALQHGHYWLEPWIFNCLTLSRTSLLPLGLPYFRKSLAALRPDMVVMLIHGAHEVMHATLQADGYIPNLTVVTDAVTIRDSWVHPYCDHIIVSTSEARNACIAHGIGPEKIEIMGHPIDPRFALPQASREELAKQFAIPIDRFTLLIMMGGTGGRNILKFSQLLAESRLPIQIIAVCGKDQRLLKRMKNFAATSPIPIYPFGFTTEIPALMTLADAVITKPGPGTIMEALACERPIILDDSNYTMYQEKGNVSYISNHGYGLVIDAKEQLIPAVRRLLQEPELYQRMCARIHRHKRADASLRIAEYIHQRLAHPACKRH